jgi:uncharacterized membrane protein
MFMASQGKSSQSYGRLQFIDFTRGVVMAIMAWDHVSGFWNRFHHGGEGMMGSAPGFLNLTWFLARFVSHYCAPTFIFLAGTVLALSSIKRAARGESEITISTRMIIRGVLLLVFEVLIVSPAFGTPYLYFGVIACIGVCFIIFSVMRKLPQPLILLLSMIIILNHNFLTLDWIPNDVWWGWYLRVIIHEPNFEWRPYVGLYSIIPWIGVMGLGWVFGSYISERNSRQILQLKRPLLFAGVGSIFLFFIIRAINNYGNLLMRQGNDLIDWLYVSKYPPSLAFLLWTLGGMSLFMYMGLWLHEKPNFESGITSILQTYGKTPLFFYLTHLWLYRLRLPGVRGPPFYLPLVPTLGLWVLGLGVLWKLCERYDLMKRTHPNSILQYI